MVDHYANSIEDSLTESLSFKLKNSASYIIDRRSVTYHPQGSNIYSTNGTKLIKILISGENWLDPQTVSVCFDLFNAGATDLKPIGGAHGFFQRLRLMCNGTMVEDFTEANRIHEMFSILSPIEKRVAEGCSAFGLPYSSTETAAHGNATDEFFATIIPGASCTVMFKPRCGLFDDLQKKFIPLKYAPLVLELELVSDAGEPLLTTKLAPPAATFSSNWQIMNVMVKCDVCTLDSQLDNSYAEYFLSGKSLPINYKTYVSQLQNVLSGENGQKSFKLSITRALSRLKNVFVTLHKDPTVDDSRTVWFRKFNYFHSPIESGRTPDFRSPGNYEIELQIAIGSKLFPEYPIRSHAEAYYNLSKTLESNGDSLSACGITPKSYRNHQFIMGVNTEKVSGSHIFTGISTKAGDVMNLSFSNVSIDPSRYATSVHVVMVSDNVLEIRDGGVQVYD